MAVWIPGATTNFSDAKLVKAILDRNQDIPNQPTSKTCIYRYARMGSNCANSLERLLKAQKNLDMVIGFHPGFAAQVELSQRQNEITETCCLVARGFPPRCPNVV